MLPENITVAAVKMRAGVSGLDVIAGYLTEINVTSPTLVQELKRFNGIDVPARFWDVVEARLAAR
jgi:glutathione synthase